jgi:hypothetical protein
MANTTFSGPVRSEGGFQVISINASTGTVTTGSTYGDSATVANLTATGSVIILSGLPTADPNVAGAIWSNSGIVTVSAA